MGMLLDDRPAHLIMNRECTIIDELTTPKPAAMMFHEAATLPCVCICAQQQLPHKHLLDAYKQYAYIEDLLYIEQPVLVMTSGLPYCNASSIAVEMLKNISDLLTTFSC